MSIKAQNQSNELNSKNNRRKKIICSIFIILCAFLIMLSNFLPWDTYMTMNTLMIWYITGIFVPIIKTFTPLTWVWSDLLPFLSVFPFVGGFLILIGLYFYLYQYSFGKILTIIGAIVAIGIFSLYIYLFDFIKQILEAANQGTIIWLEGPRIPNEFGAYFCLTPAIASLVFISLIKMPVVVKEPVALVAKEVAVPYKKKKPTKGSQYCSHCGALIKEGVAFCNQCGNYF
ncbi:MAG: zinc ribbon domain-containing protein [Promethearchaeota archaeon]